MEENTNTYESQLQMLPAIPQKAREDVTLLDVYSRVSPPLLLLQIFTFAHLVWSFLAALAYWATGRYGNPEETLKLTTLPTSRVIDLKWDTFTVEDFILATSLNALLLIAILLPLICWIFSRIKIERFKRLQRKGQLFILWLIPIMIHQAFVASMSFSLGTHGFANLGWDCIVLMFFMGFPIFILPFANFAIFTWILSSLGREAKMLLYGKEKFEEMELIRLGKKFVRPEDAALYRRKARWTKLREERNKRLIKMHVEQDSANAASLQDSETQNFDHLQADE